jgi:hypothetical protein
MSYPHPALAALVEHRGNAKAVAAELGMKVETVWQVARRAGMSVKALQYGRAIPEAPATVGVAGGGDALPSSQPVLAAARVDMASMGMEVLRLQAELDQSNRIIAILTRELEARAA